MSSILSYINPPIVRNGSESILNYGSELDFSFFDAPAVHLQSHKWAILFSLLVGSIVLPLTRYLLFHDRPPRGLKLVPGPRSTLPWLGRMHGINADAPWQSMKKWSDEYGGFFRLTTAGGEMHIWLGDAEIAQELYCKRAAIYSSRPEVAAVPGSDSQGHYLPLLEHGDHWRRQRKFAHTVLNQAFQHQYYGYVQHEVKRFLFCLMNDPKDHFSQTDRFCGRISARLCYGSPNSAAAHCKNAAEFIPQISPSASGPITNIFPFLGKLPEFINTTKTPVRHRREREERMFRSLMRGVREQVADGTAPISYARTYFERLESSSTDPSTRSFGFDENEAAYAVGMLCTVAIFTIGGPLYCFFLAMTLHPEWQAKARAEIEAVVGSTRVVDVADAPELPILRACIKEVMRWRPPVPLGVPRLVEKDDEYNGYFIPKGAVVHAIDLAIARDPKLYPDPESYNPGRWLEKEYPTYQEPLTVHPRLLGHHGFGRGRRMCPGIEITEAELLVACGSLLWAFEMKPMVGRAGEVKWPNPDAWTSNVIGGPLPFEFDLKVREGRRDIVKTLFEESEAAGLA